jgi:hypothetical protein
MAGRERLCDELAADAAGRAEDRELHPEAIRSNPALPPAIGSIVAP